MDKMKLAHEYAMKHIQEGWDINYDVLVAEAWQYADAMQAEADKRKPKGLPESLREEWQPDWSQAPEWAKWWAADSDMRAYYFKLKPDLGSSVWIPQDECGSYPCSDCAPSHNYQGNWQDSLRERPKSRCEVDWRLCPSDEFTHWIQPSDGLAFWYSELNQSVAPSFGFTGSHIVERPQ